MEGRGPGEVGGGERILVRAGPGSRAGVLARLRSLEAPPAPAVVGTAHLGAGPPSAGGRPAPRGRVSRTPVSTHRMPEAPRQPPALGRPDCLQTSPRIPPPRSRSTALGYAAPLTSQPLRAGALVPVCLSGSGTSRNIHPESPRATRGQPPFPAEPLSGAGSVDLELGRVTRAPKTHICGALVLNPAALF